jgi:2-keto-3-deoxy-L-fuconate dehydrogenase
VAVGVSNGPLRGRCIAITGFSVDQSRALSTTLGDQGAIIAMADQLPTGALPTRQRLHGLVVGPASVPRGSLLETPVAELRADLNRYLWSALTAVRSALTRMECDGALVLAASLAAHAAVPDRGPSSASGGATVAMARALAAELLGRGIRVTSVSAPWEEDGVAAYAAVAFLLGPSAAEITGVDVRVDEGWLIV